MNHFPTHHQQHLECKGAGRGPPRTARRRSESIPNSWQGLPSLPLVGWDLKIPIHIQKHQKPIQISWLVSKVQSLGLKPKSNLQSPSPNFSRLHEVTPLSSSRPIFSADLSAGLLGVHFPTASCELLKIVRLEVQLRSIFLTRPQYINFYHARASLEQCVLPGARQLDPIESQMECQNACEIKCQIECQNVYINTYVYIYILYIYMYIYIIYICV